MHKWKRLLLISLVLVLALLLVAAVAALALEPAAPAATTMTWDVVASGGATLSSSSYTMLSTAGQPVTGTMSGDNYSLLSGYWQGLQEIVRNLFMPFISR